MDKFDLVFVVLVYGNANDLEEYLLSLKEKILLSYKVVVVNSFYSQETLIEIKNIADKYNCDFLPVENKGYGTGNNRGIEYAIQHYIFSFVIVSNPDMTIENFNGKVLEGREDIIIGPKIITKSGKNQNPFYYKRKKLAALEHFFLQKNNSVGYFFTVGVNKLSKMFHLGVMYLRHISESEVYALHGSFFIIGNKVFDKLWPLFDENIFLFEEEMVLGEKALRSNVKLIYTEKIVVNHKEDGSMKFSTDSINEIERKTNDYVYNRYYKGC